MIKISVVLPSYNEEGNIQVMAARLIEELSRYELFEIIFVDDGSSDNSILLLEKLHEKDKRINYVSLSRNFGHQNALKAGLDHATGDCIISMDSDLQHPPEIIHQMITKWQDGYDIIYTKRLDNKKLSFFKRMTSKFFYKIMNTLSETKIEDGAADFRLIDRSVNEVFRGLNENDIFIRGLIKWVGFKQYRIDYYPNERFSGSTKYSIKKMFLFAMRGITAFSIKPLHLSTFIGLVTSLFAFLYAAYALYIGAFTNKAVSGWTSVIISVLFIGGLQFIMIGVMGEYIGKLFIQTKRRPLYIIRKKSFGNQE